MKIIWKIVGTLLVLAGCVWFLQGIAVLPGSFMTGETKWAIRGVIAAIVGVFILLWASRKPRGAA
jgi:hypothetical protein